MRTRDITTRISGATIARCVSGRTKKNSQRIDTEILCELKRRLRFDRIRQRFILTPAEKRMAIFILASFLLGLSTKYYRDTHPSSTPSQLTLDTVRLRNESQPVPAGASSVTPAQKRTRKSTRTEKLNLSRPASEHEQE